MQRRSPSVKSGMEHKQHECSGHFSTPSVHQTLDELEFERGIWSAALNGQLDVVNRLLTKDNDVDKRDKSGYSALHYASRSGHLDIVRVLVENGADVNAVTRSGGATPLHRAAYMGHSDILRFLLTRRANPTSRDNDGMTPLHKAAERDQMDCVRILLETAPEQTSVCDSKGRTALECASDAEVRRLLS